MRRNAGFTLLETTIAITLFASAAVYVYQAFGTVADSSTNMTLQIDLGSQNKRALTRFYNELQATSLTPQDTDGLDSTDPVPVFTIEDDGQAPKPMTKNIIMSRTLSTPKTKNGVLEIGDSKEQARERQITGSKRVKFRKVVGYAFDASGGSIVPEWSPWITYEVNDKRQLVRKVPGLSDRVVASRIDALDAVANPDGTLVVTLVTARRDPRGHGWRRYANSVTIHPKN